MKKIIIKCLCICMAFFFAPSFAQAAVIFKDNFNSHSDWSPAQKSSSYDSSSCSGSPNCVPSGYADWRVGGSSLSTIGKNTLNIDGNNYRGAFGKAFTFWAESVGGWVNDGLLGVKLADGKSGYEELYIGFWIKFDPNWKWAKGSTVGEKFLHVSHYDSALGSNLYDYFSSTQNKPRYIMMGYKYGSGCSDLATSHMISILQNPATSNSESREVVGYFPGGKYSSCPTEATGTDFGDEGMVGDGNWHFWEYRLKLNSADGAADGIVEFFQDGVLIKSIKDAKWVSGDNPLNRKWNYVWLGGNIYNDFSSG